MSGDGLSEYAVRFIKHSARRAVGEAGLTVSDVEDLEQELLLHLTLRWKRYNPSRSREHTFVSSIIRNKLRDILRRRRAEKRGGSRTLLSLYDSVEDGAGDSLQRYQTISGPDDRPAAQLRADVGEVLAQLPADLQRVCELLKRESVSDVARRLGVNRCRLYDYISQLREAFQVAGLQPKENHRNSSDTSRTDCVGSE